MQRIKERDEAVALASQWKKLGQSTVFTNGCFDLLHAGHLQYLSEAAELADRLIIGLNSDASVRRLKGKGRPIKDENMRALVLAFLRCVDMVVTFEEDTPLSLIKDLQPDVLVKGGDWKIEEIVGVDFVQSYGGEVKSLSYLEGISSTSLINKIAENND